MAIAKRVGKKPFKAKPNRRSSVTKQLDLPDVKLSTKVSKAARRIENYVQWWYSRPGMGKTTTAMEFPDAHLFSFKERGGKALEKHQRRVHHWLEWVAYLDQLEKDDRFKFTVIDTPEGAYDLCFDFMCDEVLHIDDPSDVEDYGKSWNEIYTEYMRQMLRAIDLQGKGTIFLSHVSEKTFKPMKGIEYDELRPALKDKLFERLQAQVDLIGYIHEEGDGNVMQIRPDAFATAKCRPTRQFRYTNGKRIKKIPMGADEEEAVANIMAAFRNELVAPKPRKIPKKGRRK